MNPLLIAVLAFVGVAAMVGGASLLWRDKPVQKIEDRLDLLTGANSSAARNGLAQQASILSQPLNSRPGIVQVFFERFGNISLLFEQADTNLTTTKLAVIAGGLAAAGIGVGTVARIHPVLLPLVGVAMGSLPLVWLLMRRKRRLKTFAAQLPDALEMISRTLRAGQSLAFGFNLVSAEMPQPISKEFGRVFEEQNLGVPLEESLRSMTERIPNLDLQFFVTALVLQRQTGGDLAEILDKIGTLIRDRFRIWGQVQALTGEGRLSGAVLLALPFVLFIAVYQLNPDYVMVLFKDPTGTKMLTVAVIMQIIGALVIRKIVNIKVQPVILAQSLINFESLVPLALFGTFAALAWWALEFMAAGKPRAVERLEELKDPRKRRHAAADSALKQSDAFTKVLEKASPSLAKPLQPKTEAELGKLRTRLSNAGFRSEAAGTIFLGLKFTGLVIGLFLGGGLITSLRGVNQSSLGWSVGLAGLLFYLPEIVVGVLGKRRMEAVFLALPDALDLMVVCVEAGLGLDQAMRKVADELKRTYRVLAEEFALSNFQLQMGRSRAEVLHELGARTGVSDLRSLAAVLIQADRFGSGVAQALRTQSDSMRIRRRQLAEEKAAKTAVKLIFPLVLFIFPGIFVVLVGPAAITMVRELFPMMGG